MGAFNHYARYYDLLYRDKDYNAESDYIDSLINKYARSKVNSILDIGCGTGGHDFVLQKKGYQVTGIDRSDAMIEIARKKGVREGLRMRFYALDASSFNFKQKFDSIISLFHVASYQVTNEALYKMLTNARRHLKNKGVFIFDFWYGPAVLAHRPAVRIKKSANKDIGIRRLAMPSLNINTDTVDIRYEIQVKNKKTKIQNRISELHRMRYFFIPELEFIMQKAGLKVRACMEWMTLNRPLSSSSWYGLMVAQK